ncbi:hypothetical protein [Streptomyces sp. NPDC127103]|uniref:hypothetical protein n=1 Tax=Streptomyces sp. NPDC127103 TaxID=3347139 RepID=UPI0036647683
MLPHALVVPAGAEDDGVVGEDNEDQEHGVEPARLPLTEACARELTAGLREAMDDVRRSVAVLAARVRDAHAARVWVPLGHSSWESYCRAEFGISRAQAYRLLDVARALAAIHGAVTAGPETSRTRDSDPGAAAALDYGLSQRALVAVSGRTDIVVEIITRRLTALAHSGLQGVDEAAVRTVVREAVHEVRAAPRPAPGDPTGAPVLAALQGAVDRLLAACHAMGELMLEVAPAYLSDTEAANAVALLCEQIGEDLEHGLAARRYVLSGDRRALAGTVL